MTTEATPDRTYQPDLLDDADGFVSAVLGADQDRVVEATQPSLWKAALHLAENSDDDQRRLGYALALTAILAPPGVLEATARTLRARLADNLPVMWRYETLEQTVGGTKIEMEPDGTLWLESGERDYRIDLWQTELLALRTFLEQPEVAARLDAMRHMATTAGE